MLYRIGDKMNRKFKKIFTFLGIAILPLLLVTSVKAAGDTTGGVADTKQGCDDENACWPVFYSGKYDDNLYGIRVTMVDGNGKMVSERSMDYINASSKKLADSIVKFLNTKKTYYRRQNKNGINNKLGYLR